jgi:hypothetical protein
LLLKTRKKYVWNAQVGSAFKFLQYLSLWMWRDQTGDLEKKNSFVNQIINGINILIRWTLYVYKQVKFVALPDGKKKIPSNDSADPSYMDKFLSFNILFLYHNYILL